MVFNNENFSQKKYNLRQEKKYVFMKNFSGELAVAIKPCDGPYNNPQIIYDGGNNAVLYRDFENIIVLDYINPNVVEDIKNSKSILVVEMDEDEKIKYEYYCPILNFKKIHLDENKLFKVEDLDDNIIDNLIKEFEKEFPDLEYLDKVLAK